MTTSRILITALLLTPLCTQVQASSVSTGVQSAPGAILRRAANSTSLEVQGSALQHVLLCVGQPAADAQPAGRRVTPRGAQWLELDPHGRAVVDLGRVDAPSFAQVWTPPAAGAPTPSGHWSEMIVTLPGGGAWTSTAGPGDLVVTEFMKDPTAVTDSNGEWIEVRNMLPWRLDIAGAILSDSSGASFVFDNGGSPLYLRPNESFVIGSNADSATNGGVEVDWEWSGFSLKNSADEIYFHDRFGLLMDAVEYDDGVLWPDTSGMSIALDPSAVHATLNDDPALWCHATEVIPGSTDTGTPGAVNGTCP